MTLTLKAAKRVLLAAGYDESEISELVRGIKADAWDKGLDDASRFESFRFADYVPNPYRDATTEGVTT